jgi:acyl-CoA reductase-like NAD-dependent aldehyde dehydrogenase
MAIFSADTLGVEKLANALNSDAVLLNRCDCVDPAPPWAPVKSAEHGGTFSSLGFEHLTRPKSYHFRTSL